MIVRVAHPTGTPWATFNTDTGTVLDADHPSTLEVLELVEGDDWSPGVELERVRLDHSNGARCALAMQRAAAFKPGMPTGPWVVTDAVTGAAYVPEDDDGPADVAPPPVTD